MFEKVVFKGKELKDFMYTFCFQEEKWEHMEHKDDKDKRGKFLGRELIELSGPERQWGDMCIKAIYEGARKVGVSKGKLTDEDYDVDIHDGWGYKLSDEPMIINDWYAAKYLEDLFKAKVKKGYKADYDTIIFIEEMEEAFEKANMKDGKKKQKEKKMNRK